MKIRKVKWKNHPILGNLELDFINPNTNQAFDTVILAGENGTGKTTILETVTTFLNMGSFVNFEYIEYSVGEDILRANPPTGSDHPNFYDVFGNGVILEKIRTDKSNSPHLIEASSRDIRNFGCVFSKARADYKTQKITSTTTKSIDTEKHDTDKEDDYTALKQLLVDISNQDSSEYAEKNQGLGSNPLTWDGYFPTSKTYRFKNAFNQFFDKLKYDKVTDSKNEKEIQFIKNRKTVSIDQLSTGEKQIVFRGSFLLKNSKKLVGGAIMVDEPELSMHPKWQKRILNFYKNLFTDDIKQNVQLFLATHSEYVVEDALCDKTQNLVIVLNEINGIIVMKKIDGPSVLPTITSAETNYLAFDIVSNDYHIELYGWLQNKTLLNSVKSCDNFIKAQSVYDPTVHSKPSSHGRTTYDTLSTHIRNAIDHPNPSKTYTEDELRTSTELLIELCK